MQKDAKVGEWCWKGKQGTREREGESRMERKSGQRKDDQMMSQRAPRMHQSVSAIKLYLAHFRKYESCKIESK